MCSLLPLTLMHTIFSVLKHLAGWWLCCKIHVEAERDTGNGEETYPPPTQRATSCMREQSLWRSHWSPGIEHYWIPFIVHVSLRNHYAIRVTRCSSCCLTASRSPGSNPIQNEIFCIVCMFSRFSVGKICIKGCWRLIFNSRVNIYHDI